MWDRWSVGSLRGHLKQNDGALKILVAHGGACSCLEQPVIQVE
jgi:hypothetical protein